jgi:hypothetical protein
MSSTGNGTLRIPTSYGYIDFPSYTLSNSILTKILFSLVDLSINGYTIELTNIGISIFDNNKTLIWFTLIKHTSCFWNLDLAIFQQIENTNSIGCIMNFLIATTLQRSLSLREKELVYSNF